jgi:hypothetical protein
VRGLPIHPVASRGPILVILALSITDRGQNTHLGQQRGTNSICLFNRHNCLVMLLSARAYEAEKYLAFVASILCNRAIQNRVFDAIITICSNIRPKYPLFRRPFALTARRIESSSFAPPTELSKYRNMVEARQVSEVRLKVRMKRCRGRLARALSVRWEK